MSLRRLLPLVILAGAFAAGPVGAANTATLAKAKVAPPGSTLSYSSLIAAANDHRVAKVGINDRDHLAEVTLKGGRKVTVTLAGRRRHPDRH